MNFQYLQVVAKESATCHIVNPWGKLDEMPPWEGGPDCEQASEDWQAEQGSLSPAVQQGGILALLCQRLARRRAIQPPD